MYYLIIKFNKDDENTRIKIINDWEQALEIIEELDGKEKEIKITFTKIINK